MTKALLLSLIGFAGFLVVDVGAIRTRAGVRGGVNLLAALSLGAAFWAVVRMASPLPVSFPVRLTGAILALTGALFTIYVVFVEIPLLQRLLNLSSSALVRCGTYATCRHPAFWGILLFLAGTSLLIPASTVWFLAATWATLELALVTVQDVWIFPSVFPDYNVYRRETPFLVPTRESLKAGWQTYSKRPSSFPS